MTYFVFALWALTCMRITRMVNFDVILYPLHTWIGSKWGPGSWQAEFAECPWCVGMWVPMLTAWVPILINGWSWWLYPLLFPAASMITGLLARFSSEALALEPKPPA